MMLTVPPHAAASRVAAHHGDVNPARVGPAPDFLFQSAVVAYPLN